LPDSFGATVSLEFRVVAPVAIYASGIVPVSRIRPVTWLVHITTVKCGVTDEQLQNGLEKRREYSGQQGIPLFADVSVILSRAVSREPLNVQRESEIRLFPQDRNCLKYFWRS